MKIKQIIIASALLVSVTTFAQKDELKALKKIYAKEVPTASDIVDYKTNLTKLETLATEENDKIYTTFYKSMLPILQLTSYGKDATPMQIASIATPKAITELANGLNATLDYETKTGKKIYTDDINETITSYKPELLNVAVSLGNAKRFNESSDILYAIYLLDKKDQEKLYYAAGYATNGKDYDKALKYYQELINLNYTGETTTFYAVNKASKQEEFFNTKEQRELFIKAGTHEKPRDEKVPSRRGEIYKNVALIYVEQGKTDEAKKAVSDARKANPNDDSLILTEADLYLKAKDFTTYTKIVNEALAKNPNNHELIYNLGVISADSGKLDEAEKYYRRAIELNPEYFNAYLNLSELLLRADKGFVEQMNKLGTSSADIKKFNDLKALQTKNYQAVLPLLEKAVQLDDKNDPAKRTLLGVYSALEMMDKYKELKKKL